MKKIKAYFHSILSINTSPHEIALGFAIGTFLAILPTPGLSILLGLFVILIYPKMSKFALLSAFVVFSPLVTIPLNFLALKLGDVLFDPLPVLELELSLFDKILHYSRRFLVSIFILAITISTTLYFSLKYLISNYKKKN